MNRFRFRVSLLCWLVALSAAFLAGMRYGEYRAEGRAGRGVLRVTRLKRRIVSPMTLTPSASASWQVHEPQRTSGPDQP
jgi:hypothetical protein